MDEYTSPLLAEPATTGNLSDIIVDNAVQAPHKVVFKRRAGERWLDVTCSEFLSQVQGVAKGLMAAGVRPGDRVALMSKTRYEWTLIDFAIWCAGGVTVPIYETSSAEQVQWILSDSAAVACLVETPDHLAVVEEVRGDLGKLDHLWVIDTGAVDELTAAGREIDDKELETRRTTAKPSDLATIIYTSAPRDGRRVASSPTATSSSRRPTSSARRTATRRWPTSSGTRVPRRCSSSRWPMCSPG